MDPGIVKANATTRVIIVLKYLLGTGQGHHSVNDLMGQRLPLLPQDPVAKEGDARPGPQLESYLGLLQNCSAFDLLMSKEQLFWETHLRGEYQGGKGYTEGQPLRTVGQLLMTSVAWFFPIPGCGSLG